MAQAHPVEFFALELERREAGLLQAEQHQVDETKHHQLLVHGGEQLHDVVVLLDFLLATSVVGRASRLRRSHVFEPVRRLFEHERQTSHDEEQDGQRHRVVVQLLSELENAC